MFALAAVNSSSESAPEVCNCARCSISSAGSAGGGAYCAWSWSSPAAAWSSAGCLVVVLLLFPGLVGLVVSYRPPGNERAPPCPSPESHRKLLPVRPAVIDGG